ncbi:MAG: DUF4924 family protein [Muribaculaceae bacterium]|nr:DUF4924 family protein [Muribaculaceae bacterium]
MYTASQKRKENIAEYLLYMWQIEDLIRANDLDIEKIKNTLIIPSNLDEQHTRELTQWYESLIDMMRHDEVSKSGHLQINRNVLSDIVRMHRQLLEDPKKTAYHDQFYKTLPYIVELRAKAGENRAGEIETCFNALYGLLMMRLKHQEVSPETLQAMTQISRLLAMLAAEYKQDEESPDIPSE